MLCAELRRGFFVALLLGSLSCSLDAEEFFVSTLGSDTAVGSSAMPWRTLQKAANSVTPGDRINVAAGNYMGFHLTTSGLPASPIEFVAQPGVLINQRNAVTPDGINLEGASNVVIDGFRVISMPRAGVRAVLGNHVTVRNVEAADNVRWGIFTGFVDDLLIEHNRTSGSMIEHGIYVSNSGDRPTIQHNEIWGNNANGIHMNGDASQGGDGIISGALVSSNVIYDNGTAGGSGINMDGVQNSRIENNLIYNNHASGISLYQIDGAAGSSGNVVVNNTIHQAADSRWALNIQDASTGNTILNNLLFTDHSFRGSLDISADSLPGLVSDYNVVMNRFTTDGGDTRLTLSQWQSLTGQDANSLVALPQDLFVDPPTGNYHLLPTAVARESGTTMEAPAVDLDGQTRPLETGVDRGAYEYFELAGDFDFDGDVDGRDFLVWQRNPSVGNLADWQSDYGATPPPFNAVPEPRTFPLLLFAAFQFAWRARNMSAWRHELLFTFSGH